MVRRSVVAAAVALTATVPGAADAGAAVRELVVPGVFGTANAAAGPDRSLWLLRSEPMRLTRYDGRTLRSFVLPVPELGVTSGSPLAVGRDAVLTVVGGNVLRLRPSTGALRTWNLGGRAPMDILVKRDSTVWLLGTDGRTARLEADGTVRVFPAAAGARGARNSLVEGPDGAAWFATLRPSEFVRVDRTGRARRVVLPGAGLGVAVRVGDRLVVHGDRGRFSAYRGTRLVARRSAPLLGAVATDERGRLHGVTARGTVVRVRRDLRSLTVAPAPRSQDAIPPVGPLLPGPGGRLWRAEAGGLVRYVPRPTRGLRGRVCPPPGAGGATVIAAAGASVNVRHVERGDGSPVTVWSGCATPGQRPVTLLGARNDPFLEATAISGWRLAGGFAAGRILVSGRQPGDGVVRLGLFDLRGRVEPRVITIGILALGAPQDAALGEYAVGPTGAALYVVETGARDGATLHLSRPDGRDETVVRTVRVERLRVTATSASWLQDGEQRSVRL